ncbi:hypothetical protein Spb1_20450 [Planctopirus ephydatiae]|uniref:Uncharacterized protein n=1 Tax=Planctopirus ephydatiae TaxID=2528019 RepID=A0A518GNF3_9PLAN|nr:hypothetical protein [Planctopirus ephydatiae]QDV30117.1 hypothetical protein Spb1_20450 [Planctopirus ephydatiae]
MTDFDLSELPQQFQDAAAEWERLFQETLRPVEQLVKQLQQERFQQLSRGELVDGDQWQPAERLLAGVIGIRSRNLVNSLQASSSIRGRHLRFNLRYTANYAAAFNRLRKLLPERIPPAWAEQINALLETQLARFEDVLRARGLID